MSGAVAPSLVVSYAVSADDYRRYSALVNGRRQSRRTNLAIYVGLLFGAIPVALAFRFLLANPAGRAADLIGEASLFAYLIGVFATLLAGFVIGRLSTSRFLAGADGVLGARTALFDATGITLTGQSSEVRVRWEAIRRFTVESGLLLLWIDSCSAFAIPARSFESPAACSDAIAFIRENVTQTSGVPIPR